MSRIQRTAIPRVARVAALAAVVLAVHGVRADDSVTALLTDIEKEQAKLPNSRQDVGGLLAEIGDASPAALHAWVKTNVRAVDYAGSLRDVDGVMADRTCNSLDRALLLVRLLTQSGFEAKVVGVDQPSPAAAAMPATPTPEPVASNGPSDQQEVQAKSIADAIVALAKPAAPKTATAGRHWWVRYNDGNAWVDLDPALKAPGEKLAEPAGPELVSDAAKQQIVVPASLCHRVTLVLNVERWEAGKLIESPALRLALDDPKQAALVENNLTFVPFDSAAGRATTRDDTTVAKLRTALLGETAWCPVLIDGPDSGKLAKTFDDAGVVRDVPKALSSGEKLAGGVQRGFGGMGGLGGGDAAPAEKPTVLTAVFADYVIAVPGAKSKTIRRPIFDAIGPAKRDAAAAGTAIDKPKWTEPQALARGTQLSAVHSTLVARAAVEFDDYVARFGQRVLAAKPLLAATEKGTLKDADQAKLADLLRFNSLELFAAQRATGSDASLYVAEPQIYRRVVAMTPGDGDALTLTATSDLAHNPLRTQGDAASLVRAGVLDTLRESHVVMADPTGPDHSTAALIDAATKAGATLKLLKSPADLAGLALPPDTRARLIADLTAGQWAVAPSATVGADHRFGWWRIDPVTLQTVGVMDTGYLQEFVEYTETQEVNGVMVTRFYRIRPGPAARAWAEHMMRQRPFTSWSQWKNLLKLAQQTIDKTGGMPPW